MSRTKGPTRRSYPDLKTWRTANRLSQREAAEVLEISQESYSRFERGRRFVKGELAERMMTQTGVSLEVLVGVSR